MGLVGNWRHVLRRAWSVRLMLMAAGLSGVEAVLPLWGGVLAPRVFAAATFLVTMAAFAARLIAQEDLRHDT